MNEVVLMKVCAHRFSRKWVFAKCREGNWISPQITFSKILQLGGFKDCEWALENSKWAHWGPKLEDSVMILVGLRSGHKEHHKCDITTEAVETAGYLLPRCIPDWSLPDKAIDLLDEAGSQAHINALGKRKEHQTHRILAGDSCCSLSKTPHSDSCRWDWESLPWCLQYPPSSFWRWSSEWPSGTYKCEFICHVNQVHNTPNVSCKQEGERCTKER